MYYNRTKKLKQEKRRIYAGKSLFLWEKQLFLRLRQSCGGTHSGNICALRRQPPRLPCAALMEMERVLGSPVQGELDFRLVSQAEKTEGLYPRPVIAFTLILCPTISLCVLVSGAILTPFLL